MTLSQIGQSSPPKPLPHRLWKRLHFEKKYSLSKKTQDNAEWTLRYGFCYNRLVCPYDSLRTGENDFTVFYAVF